MARLIWRDPDVVVKGRIRGSADTEWHSLLNPMRKRPERWAEIEPCYDNPGAARTAAYDINSGRNGSIPEGQWEATSRSRTLDDGTVVGVLFIRFMGE